MDATHAPTGPDPQRTFLGFARPAGPAGIRNHLLVLSGSGLVGPTARRVAAALPGARLVAMPYGGLLGEDHALQWRTLLGLALNPNVGAVLLLGADPVRNAAFARALAQGGRPYAALSLDDCDHDALTLGDRAIRAGAALMLALSRARRTPVPVAQLCVGVECGRSDPSSGLVANPLIGRIADRVVAAGGTAIFGETTEWLGAEHLLARRAADPGVAAAIVGAAARHEALAVAAGVDLLGNNPNPTNIAGGLSTLEEKSLGAIAKSGTAPIRGVLPMAAAPGGPGLWAMDGPAFSPDSVTGLVAAGAQLVLFSTGLGNSYTSLLAPTVKLSGNPRAAARLREQLDFDASGVFTGERSLDDAAGALFALCMDVADGSLTWGEVLGEGDELVGRLGEAL